MVLDPRHRRQHALTSRTDHHGRLDSDQLPAQPTITDFTNAQHDHQDADDGGVLTHAAIGTVWTAFTPRVTQSGDFTLTGTTARWCQLGKVVHVYLHTQLTSAGTVGNIIASVLPAGVPAISNFATFALKGTFLYYDASSGVGYAGMAVAPAVRTLHFVVSGADISVSAFGVNPALTGASGDQLHMNLCYETA